MNNQKQEIFLILGQTVKKILSRLNVAEKTSLLEGSGNGIGIRIERQDKTFDLFCRGIIIRKELAWASFLLKKIISKMDAKVTGKSSKSIGTSFKIATLNYHLK